MKKVLGVLYVIVGSFFMLIGGFFTISIIVGFFNRNASGEFALPILILYTIMCWLVALPIFKSGIKAYRISTPMTNIDKYLMLPLSVFCVLAIIIIVLVTIFLKVQS